MPLGHSPPPVAPPSIHRHNHHIFIIPLLLAGTLTITLVLLVFFTILLYRKLYRNRTAPWDQIATSPYDQHTTCRRFSYSQIRRATNSFSPSNHLGHGGFGSVYKAILPNASLAVKVMHSSTGSLQGEREFHNELSLSSSLAGGDSPHIVSLLGFSSDRRGRKLILVYELMDNRSLQEALLDRKCEELKDWSKRFAVAIDIAKGIEFLHHCCNPPIIHGDIKPSNILLDADFNAKIGDFGLARVKTEDCNANSTILVEEEVRNDCAEDSGSIIEETDSVITGYEEGSVVINVIDQSPENCVCEAGGASPEETVSVVSPELGLERACVSEGYFDKISVDNDSSKDLALNNGIGGKQQKGCSKRDWWWKQDFNGGCGSESGRVKDYVMDWIGSEINKERPNKQWVASENGASPKNELKKAKIKKKRKPREWWKEEFCEELTRKKKNKKKKRRLSSITSSESWFHKQEDHLDSNQESRKKTKRNSLDRWLDGFSGDLRSVVGRRNSQDSTWCDMNVPKSGGVSSTPSMRGTVCYVAPEYGGGGTLSEKCDIYSFGVLLLVLISGRRPLQITASPMSEFERANLISWARLLARNGKLLDLVDSSIHSLEKEQTLLCITIALLCLQRSPAKRPTMKEIVGMLSGVAEPPHLPFEFSPSPPMGFPFKSRKKTR